MLRGSPFGSIGCSGGCGRRVTVRLFSAALLALTASCAPAVTSPGAIVPGEAPERSDDGPPPVATRVASQATPTVGAAAPGPEVPAVTAVEGYEKIRQKPSWSAPVIGLFRAGQSVPLKQRDPLTGPGVEGCAGGWYAVEPRGFVCVGPASTLATDDVRALAAAEVLPDTSAAYPFHFGVSVGAPRYSRIPTRAEQRETERGLDGWLAGLPRLPEDPSGAVDPHPAGVGPSAAFLAYQGSAKKPLVSDDEAFAGMKVSWAREFDAEGRTWLLTPDMTLVPKDKVRVSKQPDLVGVDLRADKDFHLPLAFLWTGDAPKMVKDDAGKLVDSGETWPRHGFVPVTSNVVKGKGGLYHETRDGKFVRTDLVTVIKPQRGRPVGVGPKDKWVSVKITRGYMIAYEGDTPVYATAVSPGIDGILPRPHATTRGRFDVGWKMLSTDMSGDDDGKDWLVDEVPYVSYFKDSYALHGAWWHDEFGRPKSHGCVNLAPADARFLFGWLDPQLPQGWYAVTAFYPQVKGTAVDIRQ